MKPGSSSIERFDGWFVKPIEKLEELPEGDGAFAALMITLPLYERYIDAKLKLAGKDRTPENKEEEAGKDLGLEDQQRRIFWSIFRIGFMHQAMGTFGNTMWLVDDSIGDLPEFRDIGSHSYVCLNPWKFAKRLFAKYRDDHRLIDASVSFPLADVFSL